MLMEGDADFDFILKLFIYNTRQHRKSDVYEFRGPKIVGEYLKHFTIITTINGGLCGNLKYEIGNLRI